MKTLFLMICAAWMAAIPLRAELHLIGQDADHTYLGTFSSNTYDPDSIWNPYGRYGNPYSSTSIWNRYGTFGSRYSRYSPWNRYTTQAPILIETRSDWGTWEPPQLLSYPARKNLTIQPKKRSFLDEIDAFERAQQGR